jgi:hypothetical protein
LIFIEGRGRSNWRGGFRRGRGKKILFWLFIGYNLIKFRSRTF